MEFYSLATFAHFSTNLAHSPSSLSRLSLSRKKVDTTFNFWIRYTRSLLKSMILASPTPSSFSRSSRTLSFLLSGIKQQELYPHRQEYDMHYLQSLFLNKETTFNIHSISQIIQIALPPTCSWHPSPYGLAQTPSWLFEYELVPIHSRRNGIHSTTP